MDRQQLSEERIAITSCLQSLLGHVEGPRKGENTELFAQILVSSPGLDEPLWGNVAFVASIYSRFMWRKPLDADQKNSLWRALVWAVWYESMYRPRMVFDRFNDLSRFLDAMAADVNFFTAGLADIASILPILNRPSLEKLRPILQHHAESNTAARALLSRVEQTQVPVNVNLPPLQSTAAKEVSESQPEDEVNKAVVAIEKLWFLLDKKYESDNQTKINRAKEQKPDDRTFFALAQLSGIITRNVVYRYTHGNTGFSDDQIGSARYLAGFSRAHSTGSFVQTAQLNEILLGGLLKLRTRAIDPASLADEVNRFVDGLGENPEIDGKKAWADLLLLVTAYLGERREASGGDSVEAQSWVRVFAGLQNSLPRDTVQVFVEEAERHGVGESLALDALRGYGKGPAQSPTTSGPLSFLPPSEQREFQDAIVNSQFDRVREILTNARLSLLTAVSRVLADPSFTELQPPRSPIKIRRGRDDLFPEARAAIESGSATERQRGLALLEQIREGARKEYDAAAAGEWLRFAQARVYGAVRVAAEWEEAARTQRASWEELWNLAGFYAKIGKPERALGVLQPGVKSFKAPFAHLRFSLYCGVQALERMEGQRGNSSARDDVAGFLLGNLPKLPVPECYLCWLLLANEPRTEVDPIEQARNIANFQQLTIKPVRLLDPARKESRDQEIAEIEDFKDELQRLRLEDTWRLWVNDFAERHQNFYKGWEWLSEACERSGDYDSATDALARNVEIQIERYSWARKDPRFAPDAKYVRSALVALFSFFKRRALTEKAKAAYGKYSRMFPGLWSGDVPANSHLINLTRSYMAVPPAATQVSRTSEPDLWITLNTELATVHDIVGLKALRDRLSTAMGLMQLGDSVARERADFVKRLLNEVSSLDETTWHAEELRIETARINRDIATAGVFVDQEASLKRFKALREAMRRAFENFTRSMQIFPKPIVDRTPLGIGLSTGVQETSIVLSLTNPGPGEVSDLRVSCSSEDGAILARGETTVRRLSPTVEEVVGVPIFARAPAEAGSTKGRAIIHYRWGILEDLEQAEEIETSWCSYLEFLQQHGIDARELPNRFIYDTAIRFDEHDNRLFQGRKREIDLIRMTLMQGRPPGTPIYFHGIRRVGKTSLLNRLALELKQGPFLPLVFNVLGVDARSATLNQVVWRLTEWIARAAAEQWPEAQPISPITADHPDPLLAVEPFFQSLAQAAGDKKPVLLIDEFQAVVADHTTAVLDTLRRVYDQGYVWFVMSGNLRPEPLRQAAPRSQLLPLNQRPVDFLSIDEVEQLLRATTADLGILVPDSTVRAVYAYTAGMPNFVGKLASYGVTRLNSEQRTVLTPQDVEEIAQNLADDPSHFRTSWFSSEVLSENERSAAIRLAHELKSSDDLLPKEKALTTIDAKTLQDLEEKNILEFREGGIRIKGQLLAEFLRRQLIQQATMPAVPDKHKKVGMFVDMENMWPNVPLGVEPKEVGLALTAYASTYGRVVCRWACADPRNLPDSARIKVGLEAAGFDVSFPRPELGPKPNLVDFVMLDRITDERTHTLPDVFILITGDKDYYERVTNLLNQGYTVRVAASLKSRTMALAYRRLEEERRQLRFAEGHTETDFFVDDLDQVLSREPGGARPPG